MVAENTKYTLPEGWIWTTLDLVSKNITDGSHNPPGKQDSGIPMLSARNIENGKITFDEVRYISESDYEYENQRARIEAGDVLLTIVATIGRSAIISTPIQQRFALQRSVAAIKPLINGHFLMYVFQAPEFQKLLTDNAKGTAQKGVYLKTLRELPIPLPPLQEQHRIVAKIEELFSELDHAETGLKKAQKQLIVYRQALLKNAFEGMKSMRLDEVVEVITKGASPKWQGINYTEDFDDVLFITSENIRNNYIDIDIKKFVEKRINLIQPRSVLKKGDVLLNIVGASIGRAAYFDLGFNANINQAVALIRPLINYKYLTFFLNSPIANVYYSKRMVNVARANLSLKDVAEISVPYCSSEEQVQIVQELELKYTLIENIEKSISEGLKKAEVFRQSILKKAFRGELTNQIPNEETASSLIKRIQKEKQIYLEHQKSVDKNKIQRKTAMERSSLSVKEVLQNLSEPISAKQIWKQSKFQDDSNIDLFYAELKELEESILIKPEGKETLIAWKNENQ